VPQDRLKATRLGATAVLALVLFNFPFTGVFDSSSLVGGVPLLWAYLFVVWALVIALVAWIVRS
jgi:hypothetical protein